ncbi:MAG: 2-hydroxychromene-2-carboxylate isomerase [Myxococcota bacterium]
MARCDFFFDFSSPFAYLGSTQVERICQGHELVYRPFLLGGLFKEIGTPMVPLSTFPPAKAALSVKDQHRWAEHWGVEFNFPQKFPQRTVTPLRLVLAASPELTPALVSALFRVMWVHDGDLEDRATLATVLEKLGLDAEALLAKTEDPAVKDALKKNTSDAVEAGICGAPSFVVNGLVFWGQDRLDFVKKALEGWVPKLER